MHTPAEPFEPRLFSALLDQARKATEAQDRAKRWLLLETAHVVGQTRLAPHARVHGLMLATAWNEGAWSEVIGQAFRLALVPLGHLSGRLPLGNTGRSNVSAFTPMDIKPEILQLIDATRRRLRQGSATSASH